MQVRSTLFSRLPGFGLAAKREGIAQTTQSAAANLLRQKTAHLRRVAEKQTTASGLKQFEKKVEPVFWRFLCATLLRRKEWQRASYKQFGQLFGEKKDAVPDGNLFLKAPAENDRLAAKPAARLVRAL